jgi:hypothetical protein
MAHIQLLVALVGLALNLSSGEIQLQSKTKCQWQEGFWAADLDGEAYDMVSWDDGTGDALYVAGHFSTAYRYSRYRGHCSSHHCSSHHPSGNQIDPTFGHISMARIVC